MNEFQNNKRQFEDYGFVIFNINDNSLIDAVNLDIENHIRAGKLKTNSKIYSYNASPRIVESHKFSKNCYNLAKHSTVTSMLKSLYSSEPLAFSTINFVESTEQPLHSDYVHFGTVPEFLLAGSWIALEDIDPESGPLQIVPGSHKFDMFEFNMVSNEIPSSITKVKELYSLYEHWVREYLSVNSIQTITPEMKKGDCIIWAANLLHGSPERKNKMLQRKSQVTHWSFSDVKIHYNPNFSIPSKGKFTERKVTYF